MTFNRSYNLIVDFDSFENITSTRINFMQGEINTSKIICELKKGDKPINLDSVNVSVNIKEKDYDIEKIYCEILDSPSGVIKILIPNKFVNDPGINKFNITLEKNGSILKSSTYSYKVIETIEDGMVEEIISVTSIEISKNNHAFTEFNTMQLTATVLPSNATNKAITWSSTNNSIATVVNGLVTAKSNGNCSIKATTVDGNKVATCNITVSVEDVVPPPVENELIITMSNNLVKAEVGETKNIIPLLSQLDYSNKIFTYSSTNTNIATVNQEGLVTVKSVGTCKIKATHVETNTVVECVIEGIEGIPTNVEKTPINLGSWLDCGLGWMGEEDASKDMAVKTSFIAIDGNYPVEFTLPTGIVWSKVHFYAEDKKVLTNENQGLFCGNDIPVAGTLKMFYPPRNAKFMRVSICGADYNIQTSRFRASELISKKVMIEPIVPYDKYNSNGVILNTRHRIMKISDTYQLNATETPKNSTNGLTYTSTDTSIATVSSTGLISAIANGTCNIKVKNNKGESEIVEVIVRNVVNTGTQLTSLVNAIQTGNESTGNGNSYNVTSSTVSSTSNNPIIRNAIFAGQENKTRITLSTGNKNITFNDCVFDNVGFLLSNFTGTLKFINCEFKNWKYAPIMLNSNNSIVEFEYTTFKDAKPNKQEWIDNTDPNGIDGFPRFIWYNPINFNGSNITIRVNKCTFNNIMARCLTHVPKGVLGNRIYFNDNTVHTTEGHCVALESVVNGEALRNHFSFVGALRGSFGEESLSNEDKYFPNCFGVGGNAIYSYVETANYCDLIANYNKIRYAMENGIEGGFKEIAYNYIECTGYRYDEGYDNHSMEGIWGSARNGIHDNVIINPNMDGVRVQSHGTSNNIPCNINKNVIIYNDMKESKSSDNTGISVVSSEGNNSSVNAHNNTIIGFGKITKIDEITPNVDFDIQNVSEYAYKAGGIK